MIKKLSWLIIYLLFNTIIFFIEIYVLFKKDTTSYSSNSGFSLLDVFFNRSDSFFSILEGFAILGFTYLSIGISIVAFIFFMPLQIYYIQPKYKHNNKKFLFSLLASFSVVILLKLMLYCWMFVDLNYL